MKKSLFLFIVSLLYSFSLWATPSVWEAINAFEEGKDLDTCRALFRPHLRGTPVARPYCEHLIKDELPPAEEVFKGQTIPFAEQLQGWFRVSCVLRNLRTNQAPSQKPSIYKKLLRLYEENLPAAGQAVAELAKQLQASPTQDDYDRGFLLDLIASNSPNVRSTIRSSQRKQGVSTTAALLNQFLPQNIEQAYLAAFPMNPEGIFDPRSLVSIIRPAPLRVQIEGQSDLIDLVQLGKLLRALLQQKSEGEAYYGISQILHSKKNLLEFPFLRMAALFGHSLSQKILAMNLKDPMNLKDRTNAQKFSQEYRYYLSQSCEHGEAWALAEAATILDTDPSKAITYHQRLVQTGIFYQMNRYVDFLRSLGKKEEFAALVGQLLTHKDSLKFEAVIRCLHDFLLEIPADLAQSYAQQAFSYMSTQPSALSYWLRGSLLVNLPRNIVLEDSEFNGDPSMHLEKAMNGDADKDKESIASSATIYGSLKEKEGKFDGAIAAYEKAIQHGEIKSLHHVGKLLMDKNTPEDDIKAFAYTKRAYDEDPKQKPTAAFNLAIMHIYERGGAKRDKALIYKYLDEAMKSPEHYYDASFQRGLYMWIYEQDQGFYEYLSRGVDVDHPQSLFYLAQFFLFNSPDETFETKRKGLFCMQRAVEVEAQGSKPLCAFLLTIGIEGVFEPDQEQAHMLISNFTEEENDFYLKAFETFKKDMEATSEAEEIIEALEEAPEEVVSAPAPRANTQKQKEPSSEKTERVRQLQEEIEELSRKKQVKWKKVRSLMGQLINLTSGSFSPARGGGSGHKGKIGDTLIHLHIPHGKGHNPAALSEGRLRHMTSAMIEASSAALSEEASSSQSEASSSSSKPVAQNSPDKVPSNKKGKNNKKKR